MRLRTRSAVGVGALGALLAGCDAGTADPGRAENDVDDSGRGDAADSFDGWWEDQIDNANRDYQEMVDRMYQRDAEEPDYSNDESYEQVGW